MLRSVCGFSLVELMIGTTLGLLVTAGALQLYISNINASTDNLRSSRLHQELRASIDLFIRELRRSGYWAGEPMLDAPFVNPFQTAGNDLRLGRHPDEAEHSCILYSYDLNADKQVGVGDAGTLAAAHNRANLEQFGVRVRDGRLQLRNGGATFDCASGSWQGISDPDTEITALQFQLHPQCQALDGSTACHSGAPALLRRSVAIHIRARSRSDPRITHQLDSEVLIANDNLLPSHP